MLGLGNLLTKSGVIQKFPNDFSFNFDGSNDYLEVQDRLESVFQASYSISFWVKADDGRPSSSQSLFGYRTSANGSINNTVQGKLLSDGKLFFRYQDGTNTSDAMTNSAVFSDGATDWTHIAIVVSESADQIYIYVNGSVQTLDGTIDGDTSALTFSNFGAGNNFPIGCRNNLGTVGEFFDGLIDEFAIWNTDIGASTIAKLGSKPVDLTKYSASNLKLWLRAGDKAEPESTIARSDFYTDFDGTNDFIQLPAPFSHTNHSISVWANHSGINERIFSAETNGSTGIRLLIDDGNRLNYTIDGNNALVATAYANQWVHYVCTYDGSTMRVYANGEEVKTNSLSGVTVDTSTNARIGATSFEAGGYFEGQISSLSLYQTALDAQTIKQFAKSRFTP